MKNKFIKAKVNTTLSSRRLSAETFANQNLQIALQDDIFKANYFALRSIDFSLGEAEALGKPTTSLESDKATLLAEQSDILAKLHMSLEDIEPHYTCSLCSDTGIYEGKECACVKLLRSQILREYCGIEKLSNFHFADSNLDIFKGDQQLAMKSLYNACYTWAHSFPKVRYDNLLFIGDSGLGKTTLITAIANELLDRNISTLYLTAYELHKLILEYHTAPIANKSAYLSAPLEAEVLIIDDLGTEPIFQNMSLEYLYLILNERLINGKSTIISTNLDLIELLQRYGERIFSRLTNKNKTFIRKFTGEDKRIYNKKKSK